MIYFPSPLNDFWESGAAHLQYPTAVVQLNFPVPVQYLNYFTVKVFSRDG